METFLVEEDMMLIVIHLQQLARLPRAVRRQPFHKELRLLRRLKMHFRSSRHISRVSVDSIESRS
jgi:hypothetical protein